MTRNRTEELQALGFSIVSSGPLPAVSKSRDGSEWPHLSYQVRILKDGKELWAGPYKLGTGHAKITKVRPWKMPGGLEGARHIMATGRRLVDKQMEADVACWFAIEQKVKPSLADVLNSLLLDGQAYGQTFEDWCGEFGYDSDSITDRETFQACEATGRCLARNLTKPDHAAVAEILQDY